MGEFLNHIDVLFSSILSLLALGAYIVKAGKREENQNLRIAALEKKTEDQSTEYLTLSTQLTNMQTALARIETNIEWIMRSESKGVNNEIHSN